MNNVLIDDRRIKVGRGGGGTHARARLLPCAVAFGVASYFGVLCHVPPPFLAQAACTGTLFRARYALVHACAGGWALLGD